MRLAFAIGALSAAAANLVHAVDGGSEPIDWSEAGAGSLRACAQAVFTGCCGNWQHEVQVDRWLGCDDQECLCRPDLIADVHKYIKKFVSRSCGEKRVDVDAALKLYNDYCSSNGFPIPGYTYISTQTVRVTTATTTETTTAPKSKITKVSEDDQGEGRTTGTTVSGETPGTKTTSATPTARESTFSPGPRVHPLPWTGLIVLFALIPVLITAAQAQTLVVTFTESIPPAAFSTVTTLETVLTKPLVSTLRVAETENPETTRSEDSPQTSQASTAGIENRNNGTGSNGGSGESSSGKAELSQLEVAGIVIGVVLGTVTTVATVWMCMRGRC